MAQAEHGGGGAAAAGAPAPGHRHGGLADSMAALTMVVGRGRMAGIVGDLTGVGPGDRVVDVGCGPGTAVRAAARRGADATGVDPLPFALRLARMHRPKGSAGPVTYLVGTAEALPLADDSMTLGWAISSAHHWSDVPAALAELGRVLGPGGRFAIVERAASPGARGHAAHGFTDARADEVAALAAGQGFVDVTCTRAGYRSHRMVVVAGHRP